VLFLSAAEVRACLPAELALSTVEEALAIQESGAFHMPERMQVACGGEGNIELLMPCVTESAIATKLVTVFPGNAARGVPAIGGLVVLMDPATGQVRCLLDGKTLTAIRTGAVTGVSARHLAREDAETLGLVGCGVQAFDQVRHACAARPIRRVLLASRTPSSVERLRARLAAELAGVEVHAAESIEALMRASDVLVTSTTARAPVLPDDPALYEGKHCVAMGSFEASVREYPDAVFARTAKVWVDTPHAVEESGELGLPLATGALRAEQIETLGAHIASGAPPDRGAYGTTFFKSVGMALLDLQAASAAYRVAQERGLGTVLPS